MCKENNYMKEKLTDQWRIQDFPGGRRKPLSLDQKPIIWQDFYQKLHEKERKLDRELLFSNAPFDPPMLMISKEIKNLTSEKN